MASCSMILATFCGSQSRTKSLCFVTTTVPACCNTPDGHEAWSSLGRQSACGVLPEGLPVGHPLRSRHTALPAALPSVAGIASFSRRVSEPGSQSIWTTNTGFIGLPLEPERVRSQCYLMRSGVRRLLERRWAACVVTPSAALSPVCGRSPSSRLLKNAARWAFLYSSE